MVNHVSRVARRLLLLIRPGIWIPGRHTISLANLASSM
jgi:hypothetical protein